MRELLAQTVRMTDPRCRDYGIVRDLHPQHDNLVRVEWLTGAWKGHVTDWTAAVLVTGSDDDLDGYLAAVRSLRDEAYMADSRVRRDARVGEGF